MDALYRHNILQSRIRDKLIVGLALYWDDIMRPFTIGNLFVTIERFKCHLCMESRGNEIYLESI